MEFCNFYLSHHYKMSQIRNIIWNHIFSVHSAMRSALSFV
jgi:hypothetical protein